VLNVLWVYRRQIRLRRAASTRSRTSATFPLRLGRRIFFERVNEPFLAAGGSGEQFRAGIERAIALGWLWRHESGTYVRFIGRRRVIHD